MKYKILHDYRSEGYAFVDGEFNSVGDAVEEAMEMSYSAPFLIVHVVDWKAVEYKQK